MKELRRRRTALAVELLTLPVAALVAVLVWGQGRFTVGNLWLAATYTAYALGLTITHHRRTGHLPASVIDSSLDVLKACSTAALGTIATASILGAAHPGPMALRLWILTVVSVCGARLTLQLATQRARRRGGLMTPTLVVGAGVVGGHVVRRLLEKPELGLRPVGFLDADPMPGAAQVGDGVSVLGGPDDLAEVCAETGARHVILAFASERDHRLVGVVNRCRELGVEVSVVPRLYELINERAKLDHIGGLPLLSLQAVDPTGWQFKLKHGLDRAGALLALLVLAPMLAAVAVAVRLSSPGPVIFRQRRIGRDGRVFDLLKFRTMSVQAGPGLPFALRTGVAPGGVEGADRRTAVGRWLRSTSLDELPQLVNVLRGEMSLVGPRPERPEFAEQFTREVARYGDRHRVKSGITGWAQVNGLRGQTSIADRVEWDNHYIENWSLGLELRTLALTLAEVVRFREDKAPSPIRAREHAAPKPMLRLVEETADPALAAVWFCGYCAATAAVDVAPAPLARVCSSCGDGLLLEARADGAPRAQEAFLVVDSLMTVQAVSRHAERFLGVREQDATDQPIGDLLVGADAETETQESLGSIVVRAASSDQDAQYAFVRPQGTFGVRLRARISSCGPPRAALIVLESEPTQPPRLRIASTALPAAEQQAL